MSVSLGRGIGSRVTLLGLVGRGFGEGDGAGKEGSLWCQFWGRGHLGVRETEGWFGPWRDTQGLRLKGQRSLDRDLSEEDGTVSKDIDTQKKWGNFV